MIGRTLVDLNEPSVPVRVMNLSDHPKSIKKGSVIAKGEFVQCVYDTQACLRVNLQENYSEVPEHLQVALPAEHILS